MREGAERTNEGGEIGLGGNLGHVLSKELELELVLAVRARLHVLPVDLRGEVFEQVHLDQVGIVRVLELEREVREETRDHESKSKVGKNRRSVNEQGQ